MSNTIYAIGMGPGSEDLISPKAISTIEKCDVIAGYTNYIKMYSDELWKNKELIATAMRGEVERCKRALDASLDGKSVGIICSGDAGIYAMAGLLLEIVERESKYAGIEVETIAGITAASAAASVLGAPLMNDFAMISLSDLMTPIDQIKRRLKAVAQADMVCVLYNPASKKRRDLIQFTVDTFMAEQGGDCVAGFVHHASRTEEQSTITTLGSFPFDEIGMSTLVVIGNSKTVHRNGRMYTERGYLDKYSSQFEEKK